MISKKINYSAYYIQRVFSAVTHIPIHEYITERRLVRAGEEILNGSRIVDAAMKYGYSSHNGFTKAFQKKFGMPPSKVNECVSVIMDKPLRILERNFYNKDGNMCICHEVIELEELKLIGHTLTVNLKEFWRNEKMKHNVFDEVTSFINENGSDPTYCIGIPKGLNSEVQYFIGRNTKDDVQYLSTEHKFTIPKSTYIKFSYKGNLGECPNIVIDDALKCFSACNIKPYQDEIDHIEVFTKDYLETEVFDIMVPIKRA